MSSLIQIYNSQVEELKKQLLVKVVPIERLEHLHHLAYLLSETDKEVALEYAQEALNLSEDLENFILIGTSWRILTRCYNSLYDFDQAQYYGEKAEALFSIMPAEKQNLSIVQLELGRMYYYKRDFKNAAIKYKEAKDNVENDEDVSTYLKCCGVLGMCFYKQGNFKKAKECSNMGLERDDGGRTTGHASLYNMMGVLYVGQKAYKKALYYYQKASNIWQEQGMYYWMSYGYNNMGLAYQETEEYDKALEFLFKSLEIFEEQEHYLNIALLHNNIGGVYNLKGDFEQALEYLEKGLNLRLELKDKVGASASYFGLADVYFKMDKDFETIQKYLEKSLELLEGREDDIRFTCYKLYIKLYVREKNIEKAFQYQSAYIQIKDAVTVKNIQEMEQRHEMVLKEAEIEKLNVQQKILQEHNKELQIFAAKAGHDLKAPLATIRMYNHLLKRQLDKNVQDKNGEYLEVIQQATENMFQLVDELIKYTLASVQKIDLNPMDVNVLLKIVLNNLKKDINENKALIEHGEMPVVLANKTSIIQLFQNILSNAIKFRSKDTPHILIDTKDTNDGFVTISIKDNGIGIKEEDQQHVFDLFQRGPLKSAVKGSGIGLATCKKLVEQLGGKIWVKSQVNKGTTFFISLKKHQE